MAVVTKEVMMEKIRPMVVEIKKKKRKEYDNSKNRTIFGSKKPMYESKDSCSNCRTYDDGLWRILKSEKIKKIWTRMTYVTVEGDMWRICCNVRGNKDCGGGSGVEGDVDDEED
ncbi:unnamed protein product [Arabidopsis lyrata]|uniref:Predicted protein n=1 Tax=Arabidopsis lyrata subsp. lyrata TaxID=81972 RepID=D7MIV6_ARALL|nr:predicted protein [Arabidopsis lyrata subsp. lyrata]CAH8277787.1 unnamed protein product [Arabidopsis lyrata]